MDEVEQEEWTKVAQFLNSTKEEENEEFRDFARRVLLEFSSVADYIWKTPNFIEHETTLEQEKLSAYFPLSGNLNADEAMLRLRKQRWALESHKLFGLFPNLMAVGNLFVSLAMFEAHCLRLARLIEQRSSHSVASGRRRGVSKIFEFFSISNIQHFTLPNARQVEAALSIRNCLIHAEGLLSWDKNEESLRRIIGKGTYLSPFHLERRKKLGRAINEVVIVTDDLGDRIKIDNDYPFVVTTYGQSYLMAAAQMAHRIYGTAAPT